MRRLLLSLISVALLMGAAVPSGAQSLGLLSSPNTFGAMLQWYSSEDEMEVLTVLCDAYGVTSGMTGDLGARLSYTHNYVLGRKSGEGYEMCFRIGAGAGAGYVHDNETGIFPAAGERLKEPMGMTLNLSCTAGVRMDFFRHKVTMDLSFVLEPGIHIRPDNVTGDLYVSLYKNGLYQIIMPRLTIMYRFR